MISIYLANIHGLPTGFFDDHFIRVLEKFPSPEIDKYCSFRFAEDKKRLVAGKFLLLKALKDVNISHSRNNFCYTLFKRLCLTDKEADFNISHSGDYVACSVAIDRRIGIDVERKRDIDFVSMSEAIFSEKERKYIFESDRSVKQRFYELWTLKESYCKAFGTGISDSMKKISFNCFNGLPVLERKIDNDDCSWQFHQWELESDYQLSAAYSVCNGTAVPSLVTCDLRHLADKI